MAWPKGRKKLGPHTGGRKKGTPNGIPREKSPEIREMVLKALDRVGGVDYLTSIAHGKPQAFLMLVSRLIPTQVNADVSMTQPVEIHVVTGFDSGPHAR